MKTIARIDWAEPAKIARHSVAALADRHSIECSILEDRGPGGGWPLVELSGSGENVMSALREYSPDESDEELRELYMS